VFIWLCGLAKPKANTPNPKCQNAANKTGVAAFGRKPHSFNFLELRRSAEPPLRSKGNVAATEIACSQRPLTVYYVRQWSLPARIRENRAMPERFRDRLIQR
jgi:hypothetical protein